MVVTAFDVNKKVYVWHNGSVRSVRIESIETETVIENGIGVTYTTYYMYNIDEPYPEDEVYKSHEDAVLDM